MSKIVLCVDDSVTMQQVADITFRGTEFTYVGARNYDEAMEKAKGQKPTVVLADSVMPGKTGYDLCQALKSDPKFADVPVVILVGNGAPYDTTKGTQAGADANLPKPWDTQTMLEKVAEVVAKGVVAKPGQASAAAAAPAAAAKPAVVAPPAAAASSGAANQPPRSATIMGMPTIKLPGGVTTPATPATPSKTTVMAVPPISPDGKMVTPAAAGGLRAPAPAAPAAQAAPAPGVAASPAPSFNPGVNRSPMVSGTPTKRSALVERTLAKMAARLAEASGLEPGSPELAALLKLSTEVVERIVWEVVPELAEQIIRENLQDLTARKQSS
ncbi:MAG: response regulator [Deltaproteobacteria bacterium]|nr:response regulator [Deltaproteobacteria bacterium]